MFRAAGRYILFVLIALDQLANALLFGYPDETLSSRMGREQCFFCRMLCNFLNRLDPGHCGKAIQSEMRRRHDDPENRK